MRKLNVLKNIIASSIVFTMSAVLGLSGVVSPKAANNVKIQKYEQKGEKLNIAFSGIKDPKEKNTKVIIGEQEFQVDKIENAEDYGKGISYIFLVDVSGSVSPEQYDFMEHIMKSLVKKSNVDNIKIILVGETVKFFDNESGKKDTMIDKIKSIRERAYEAGTAQTNLYKGIVDALEAANNDSEMNLVRSLVIFSDGFEEKGDSLTQNEVLNAVREQRVPVFTVPVESGISVGGDEDTNEILSSFARESAGGAETVYKYLNNSDDVIDTILSKVRKINVAQIDIKALKVGSDNRDLKLEHKGESDSISLNMSDLDIKTSDSNRNTVIPDNVVPNEKKFPIIPIVIGAAVLIAGVLVVILIMNMNSGKMVLMFDMGNGNVKKEMKDKLIIGRDDRKSGFAMPNDNRLSSMHCMIYVDHKNLYIKDLDSTNGTYLNGRRVQGSKMLNRGDILLIGSVEMRVNWE